MKMQVSVVQEDVDALNILERRARDQIEQDEVSIKIDKGGLPLAVFYERWPKRRMLPVPRVTSFSVPFGSIVW